VVKLLEDSQENIQMRENTNLIDYVYMDNAAYVHFLAIDHLLMSAEIIADQLFFITNRELMAQ
ncbi:uncharacterized protein BT62DRAFT_913359, partial [Guyanagaster necrorhizus]